MIYLKKYFYWYRYCFKLWVLSLFYFYILFVEIERILNLWFGMMWYRMKMIFVLFWFKFLYIFVMEVIYLEVGIIIGE